MEIISKKLRKYFLESLSGQEAEEIDLRIISDADFAEQLENAETDLIEDYLEGTLSAEEIKQFETNFLISQERQKRLDFLKTFKKFAQCNPQPVKIKDSPPSFFESLKTLFTLRKFAFGFGLIGLIIVLGIGWRIIVNQNGSVVDAEIAELNQKDLSNLEDFKSSTNLSLVSGTLRSPGSSSNLMENKLTDKVLLRLGLPNNLNSAGNFTVKISKDGKSWQIFNQRSYQNQSGNEVRLVLPSTKLKKGEYKIELEKDGEKYNYNFAVE